MTDGVVGLSAGCLPGGVLDDAGTVSSCNGQAMRQVEGFSFDGELDLLAVFLVDGAGEAGAEEAVIRISGAIALPDRVRFTVRLGPDGETIETAGVIVGEDVYMQEPGSSRWYKGGPREGLQVSWM